MVDSVILHEILSDVRKIVKQNHIYTPGGPRRIYIAGPYTQGDVAVNVRRAVDVGDQYLRHGFFPFIPHLCHFWHFVHPHEYQTWMDYTKAFLVSCVGVNRIPGKSPGSDIEVNLARSLGIPVFADVQEALQHFAEEDKNGWGKALSKK